MGIPLINNSIFFRLRKLTGRYGNTAGSSSATIATANDLISTLNSTIFSNYFASYTYIISEIPGVVPVGLTRIISNGAVPGDCNCVDGGDFDHCKEGDGKPGFKCSDTNISMNRIAPGTYDVVLAPTSPAANFAGFAVTFGNVGALGVFVNLLKVSPTQYTATAFSALTGAPIDGVLTDTLLEVKVWG